MRSGWTISGWGSAPKRTCATFVFTILRHTHASLALRQGETVLAIGRLLGHRSPETTLKYTHLADAMVMDAAETVGAVLGQGTQLHPFDASSGSSSG